MYTRVNKSKENKSRAVANVVFQKQIGGESPIQFVDNRPEAVSQRKLHKMADNSRQVKQLRALQEMANNSPQAKQVAQLQAMADNYAAQQQQPIQKKENKTGLPDDLKTGIENLSGYSMDDVKVHYNSDKPAQLQAHAYAQGTDIHIASGQENHLPHEAWHVVQQKQGRVKPTMQIKGEVNLNDDKGLEKEADVLGIKALSYNGDPNFNLKEKTTIKQTVQRTLWEWRDTYWHAVRTIGYPTPQPDYAGKYWGEQISTGVEKTDYDKEDLGGIKKKEVEKTPTGKTFSEKWGKYNDALKFDGQTQFVQFVPGDAQTIEKSLKSQKLTDAVYNPNKAFWVSNEKKYTLGSSLGKVKMIYTFTDEGAKSLMEDNFICGSGDFEEDNEEKWSGETAHPQYTIWKTNEIGAYGIGSERLAQLESSCEKIEKE